MNSNLYCYYFDFAKDRISVGRGIYNTICIPWDSMISEEHFVFEKSGDDVYIRNLGRDECYVNCFPDASFLNPFCSEYAAANNIDNTAVMSGERIKLEFGDTVIAGETFFIYLCRYILIADYDMENKLRIKDRKRIVRLKRIQKYELFSQEEYLINKNDNLIIPSKRAITAIDSSEIEMDYPPARPTIKKRSLFMTIGPAFTMAIPMVAASFFAMYFSKTRYGNNSSFMYTGIITASLAAMLGTFWGCMNVRNEKISRKRQERKRRRAYNEYVRNCERKIGDRYRNIRRNLIKQFPSVKDFLIDLSKEQLWNHSNRDQDYLFIRLGLGETSSNVPIKIPKAHFQIDEDRLKTLPDILSRKYSVLKEVPVCISLLDNKVIGLVSSSYETGLHMVYIIVGQLIFHYSPLDIKIVFILINQDININEYIFCRFVPHFSCGKVINICKSDDELSDFIPLLEKEIISSGTNETSEARHFVIFTDSYSSVSERIKNSPNVIIFILCSEYRQLPGECNSIIQNAYGFSGLYELSNASLRKPFCFDGISVNHFQKLCRFVSGYSICSNHNDHSIPKVVSIDDIYNRLGKELSLKEIMRSWNKSNNIDSMKIPIGIGENNRVCFLDLHESYHGPHGLIAGMTGSGKSELLGAIILMLSLKYSPHFVNFFLIDYKGGGMSNLFSKLPHLCASISNLSDNLIYRAMVSIRSENKRRQKLFLKYHVNCIRDYEKLFISGDVEESLPHILIIIDEFAELKRSEPEFMRELISVAQVGRSLGIHLILATQRPQGVVDDNILGNSRFRICLRVQDRQDSMDVIKRADAAGLNNPGRAFFQVGNDELFEEFQGIYTMSPYSIKEHNNSMYAVSSFGKEIMLSGSDDSESLLQHTAAMQYIKEAAQMLEGPKVKPLFSSVLPKFIDLSKLDIESRCQIREQSYYPIGKYDDIENQKHKILYLSFIRDGHMIVCGMQGSGKSTLLKTLLYEVQNDNSAFSKVIYIIDTKSSFPKTILESPFVCGYFSNFNFNSIGALFHRVNKTIKERREKYKGKPYSEVSDNQDPLIIIFIDNYGFFRDETKEKFDREIFFILKNGEALGVFLIISGNMIGNGEIPAKVHELVKTVICLALIDKLNYLQIMRLPRIDLCPEKGIKGRGIVFVDNKLYEFQTAMIVGDEEKCFHEVAGNNLWKQNNTNWRLHNQDYFIPVISNALTFEDFSNLVEIPNLSKYENRGIPVGYILESYEIYEFPILDANHFFITGRINSGKKNLAKVISSVSERAGCIVEIIDSIGELSDFVNRFRNEIKTVESVSNSMEEEKIRLIVINNPGSVLCNSNIGKVCKREEGKEIDKETERNLEKDIEDFLYCNSIKKKREGDALKILTVLSREDERKLTGRRLFDALKNNAYSIHLGGYVDEQHIADYSYLGFSEKGIALEAGQGYVMPSILSSSGGMFRGKITIPLWTK